MTTTKIDRTNGINRLEQTIEHAETGMVTLTTKSIYMVAGVERVVVETAYISREVIKALAEAIK